MERLILQPGLVLHCLRIALILDSLNSVMVALFLVADFLSHPQWLEMKHARLTLGRRFKQLNNISCLNRIPVLKHRYIKIGREKMHIGTIIKRPLNYPLISKLEFHYGIVIGTTAKGDVVILDMTSEHDIAFRELNDFMAGFSLSTLEVHCHCRTVTLSMIIERLQPVQYEVYDLVDFNCRDFAELIVLSIQPQKRSKPINEFRLILNNIAIAGTELMLSNPNNESVKGILINHLGNLKFNRIRLQDSLSD